MSGFLRTWEYNHWCPAFLDSRHPLAVSKETEPAVPLTVCEFQRPSAAEDSMQPWQRQRPPQRLADQEHPPMLLDFDSETVLTRSALKGQPRESNYHI